MSKYFDENSRASQPGRLALSERKLRDFEPELFTERTFKCGPVCDKDHPAEMIRERLAEHLQHGCCGAAVVVSTAPLVVGVYASDLDAALLLRYPPAFVERYRLSVGSRLCAVNSFHDEKAGGKVLYAVDLIPGPDRTNWSTFTPAIAEFLSDETELIEEQKRKISEVEWAALERTAKLRIERMGLKTARDGRPSLAGMPERQQGGPYFQSLEDRDRAAQAATDRKALILKVVLAIAGVVALILLKSLRR